MKRVFIILSLVLCVATSGAEAQQSDSDVRFNRFIAFAERLEVASREAYAARREGRSEIYKEAMRQHSQSPTAIEEIDSVAAQADSLLHQMVELMRESKPEEVWKLYTSDYNSYVMLSYFSTDELGFDFHVGFLTTVLFNIFSEEEATRASQSVVEPFVALLDVRLMGGREVDVDVYVETKFVLMDIYAKTEQLSEEVSAAADIIKILEPLGEEYDSERLMAYDTYILSMRYGLHKDVDPAVEQQAVEIINRILRSDKHPDELKHYAEDMLGYLR